MRSPATCSPTWPRGTARDRAPEPGRGQLRHVRGLRSAGKSVQGVCRLARRRGDWRPPMNLAPPVPRLERARRAVEPGPATRDAAADRTPVRAGPARFDVSAPGRQRDPRRRRGADRPRHPDGLFVVGDEGSSSATTRSRRRSADPVGDVGLVAMVVDDAGRLPLPAPRLGAAVRRRRRPSVLVFVPAFNIVVGGSARWLDRAAPRLHPAEFAKLALVVYLAHWLARRGARTRASGRHGPVPRDHRARHRARLKEPDLGTTGVSRYRVHDVLRGRREPRTSLVLRGGRRVTARRADRPARLPAAT